MKNSVLGALAALLALAGTARAQIGPDVITWRIGQTIGGGENIANYAPANGMEAYSFCTVSCNIGDAELLWESGGSIRHPVIAQNLFRLKDGRFEQLGQSFLKHGFCALSQGGCGVCQATPCSTLGIGCADTYGAGLNDGAGGGRKAQVNSCRGDHIHPYSAPSGTDPNRGRLMAYTSEVDPSVSGNDQAEYFIEGQYVTEDDQVAGNVANNASWRRVSVDASNDLHLMSGYDTIVEPAIYAWRASDPLVVVNEVSNADEGGPGIHGLFYAAARASNNGDGTWTYSYAVQNLSSDDAGYSFAVPAASSLSVTHSWFTAVEWHSGEPYNNLPWSFSHAGGSAKWTCAETHAQNPDANALRWGTQYSFGFTADAGPSAGPAELTLFTTGGVLTTSLAHPDAAAIVGCPGDDLLEDNDDCVTAYPIGTSTINGLQVHGTGSTVDWDYYELSLAANGQVDVDIYFTHANGDLDLFLYDAASPGCGTGASDLTRSESTTDDEFVTYYNTSGAPMTVICEVRTYGAVTCTDYNLSSVVTILDPCTAQADDIYEDNDDCASAIPFSAGSYAGLVTFGDACGDDEDFYAITLAGGEQLNVDVLFSHADGDIDVHLYDATGGTCGTPVDTSTSVSDNEDVYWANFSGGSITTVLRVYAYGGSFGFNDYDLNVVILPAVIDNCMLPDDPFEDNDSCATARVAQSGTYSGLRVDVNDDDYFRTLVAPGERIDVDIFFSDAEADVDLYLYDSTDASCGDVNGTWLARGYSSTDDESIDWTNNTAVTVEIISWVRVYGAGTENCVFYDMAISVDGDLLGAPFCLGDALCPCLAPAPGSGEGCVNVTGVGAYITASGVPSIATDTLVLTVYQAAPSDFGIFVQNTSPAPATPFYNGLLCLPIDSHLVRHYAPPAVLPTVTDAAGVGSSMQPMTVGDFQGDTQAGVTIYYQFWGRDNGNPCGTGANFSSGRSITWLP